MAAFVAIGPNKLEVLLRGYVRQGELVVPLSVGVKILTLERVTRGGAPRVSCVFQCLLNRSSLGEVG